MAHKTFISYKYSEARGLRDRIINALGEDAKYYRGEDGFSDDLSDCKAETIKCYLADMIYDTSVTIVIISPNMNQSERIDWELSYSLKSITRSDRTSHPNGIVGVVMEHNGNYDWFIYNTQHNDGCTTRNYYTNKCPKIITENRANQKVSQYCCPNCKSIDPLFGSYISFVKEDEFLDNPQKYIDNAYNKSQNDAEDYNLTREV